VGHAQSRQAPGILEIGIQRKAVVLNWQGSAMPHDFQRARVIVRQSGLEFFPPFRSSRWQAAHIVTRRCEIDGSQVEARVQAATTAESDLLWVQFVEIMKDAAHCNTLIVVQGM